MQRFIGISHLLLVLLMQRVPAQISQLPEEGHSTVIPFLEVWEKSMCRPIEQLVDVWQEYPGEVEYIYIPACVPLWRCSGCCADENLVCQPTVERNITLQVKRIRPMISLHDVELTFVEHHTCECSRAERSIKDRPKRRKQKKTANGCRK